MTPHERWANALRRSVQPQDGRREGLATALLSGIGEIPGQMVGNVKNMMDAAYSHPMGASVADNPQYGGLVADTAFNMVGMPALTGGVPASAFGSAAKGIRAYHGSPHDFDRFDISKIGTGEGAQAYGHGLYFAEREPTARAYREGLSFDASNPQHVAANAFHDNSGNRNAAVRQLNDALAEMSGVTVSERDAVKRALDILNDPRSKIGDVPTGRMYEVNIDADPSRFLDWDAPLKSQPVLRDVVRAYGDRSAVRAADLPGQTFYQAIAENKSPERASQALLDRGIPGIKYLDQGSRWSDAGTSNYVVFDDKLIDIIRKYGIAGMGLFGLGAQTQQEMAQ